MSPYKSLLALVSITGLWFGVGPARADDLSPPPRPGREFCKENPGKCEEARARHAAFCQENPQKCEQARQRRAERRERCKQDPEKCAEQKAAMKKRREERQARCQADPSQCDEGMQHRYHHGAPGPGPKPAD
jgi:hypothetical protein